MQNFWEFSAWGFITLMGTLLISLLLANVVKKKTPFLRDSLIPTSVLGGAMLLILASLYELITGDIFFNTAYFGGNGAAELEVITYHALALGFIATAFKSPKTKHNLVRGGEIFDTGVTTVSSYLLQGIFGLGLTLLLSLLISGLFPAAGLLLPFGYGQGTGQALNYGTIYETEYGFVGGRSFGLTIAALGFLSAAIGGVIHLNILKRRGKVIVHEDDRAPTMNAEEIQGEDEIPMNGSVDKLSIQFGFVFGAYMLAHGLMILLSKVLPSLETLLYGFNFLIGVLVATIFRTACNLMRRRGIMKKQYVNGFLMDRVSGFCFDIMVVAGIAAIRLELVAGYWWILLVLGVLGAILTYFYNRFVARRLFPSYTEEQFLVMYGMLTGTASTGIILLREIDPDYQTPAADNLVYQNFPAILFGFPLMLLANLAPTEPTLTLAILAAFFLVMNLILFRRQLFGKKRRKGKE